METAIYIILIIAQLGVLYWFLIRSRKKGSAEQQRRAELVKEFPFEGMRNAALKTTPGALLAQTQPDELLVYGIVMDWDMGDDVISLAVQITGDANLYVKSGGGIVGSGKYPEVIGAAQAMVLISKDYMKFLQPAIATPLPEKGQILFYLQTNQGLYSGGDSQKIMENPSSQWHTLYEAANHVIHIMKTSAFEKKS